MEIALQAINIYKTFGNVRALNDVNINIYKGKVMALLGENGAGKSTLIKCITGVLKPNQGKINVFGNEMKFSKAKDSIKKGIAVVHQELQLCNNLPIYENIWLGRNIKKLGIVSHNKMKKESRKYLDILGINLNPKILVGNLTVAQQQMVEIAKALSLGARILILDEPTDALSTKEVNKLFQVIQKLKEQGIAILYVTHRMEEIKKICEYYTIFKDGKFVKEGIVSNTSINQIIEGMIGRELKDYFPKLQKRKITKFLVIENLSNQYIFDVSLEVYSGEILGIAGLVGSQRTEFAKTLIGILPKNTGLIKKEGKKLKLNNVNKTIKHGIFYVTEDRKKNGLILNDRIDNNMVVSNIKRISNLFNLISYKKQKKETFKLKENLNIKINKLSDKVSSLSGGNQQKVLLSKALFTNPSLLILDEPTRGVDVGARKEIYKIIVDYAKKGKAIIIISSDMSEIIGISDRVAVFKKGRNQGILTKKEINEKNIINLAIRGRENNA